ncbi:MAG: hypothetical protein GX300_03625 [Tissierellia bacterium]|nr:hypothetical protein [Tissierellia bacterium]
MKKIPNFNVFNKWNDYYETEELERTDIADFDHLNPRRPDAYINFNSNIFPNPQYYFNDPDEMNELDWD